jgi:hypothetical protein
MGSLKKDKKAQFHATHLRVFFVLEAAIIEFVEREFE